MKPIVVSLFVLFLTGCAGSSSTTDAPITVAGIASVRGNEPFTAVVLETEQRNVYVLTLDDDERSRLQREAPLHVRVTGTVYKDTWGGRPLAHLRVQTWAPVR